MSEEEKQEWDRLSGESSKAYAHFCLYRDMGVNRSLRTLEKADGCTSDYRQLGRWSSRWRWVDRCQKYEDHLEHQDRLQQEKERREMHKRHAKMGMLAQTLALRKLEKALNRIEQDEDGISAPDAARILDVGVKVERQARGESTESHEVSGPSGGPIEFANMSDDQRRTEMIRCLKDMGKTSEEALAIAAQLMGDDKRV
jgi:hypothetical protein